MQFTIVLATLAASLTSAAAVAQPKPLARAVLRRQASVCPGIDAPQCCEFNAAGVASLTCSSPGDVASIAHFQTACAESGLSAQCCTLVVVSSTTLLCLKPCYRLGVGIAYSVSCFPVSHLFTPSRLLHILDAYQHPATGVGP